MKIELIDYAIENEGTSKAWADLSIMADGIGPIRWHIILHEWDLASRWVTYASGIGVPGDDYDLSVLSADDRSLLLGERHDVEDVQDFEAKVESALREQMNAICKELNFLEALDRERDEKLELS